MGQEVEWVDTPPPKGNAKRSTTRELLQPFEENPGRWGYVTKDFVDASAAATWAWRIKSGVYAGIAEGDFDARADKVGDTHKVCVCYIGGES